MFKKYSSEYAAAIASIAGFVVIICRVFGVDFAEEDAVFAVAVLFDLGGNLILMYKRYLKGDVTPIGVRK